MITIPSLGNLALISGSPSQTSEMPTKSGNRNGSVRFFFIPQNVWKKISFSSFILIRWADLSRYYLISELDSKALCTRTERTWNSALNVDVVRVYFRPQCLLYYFYVCVLDMPHCARLQPPSICSDVLDHLFLSLCLKFLIFKRTVTEKFGNCSSNGKLRSFVGVQSWCQITFVNEKLE